MIDSLPRDRPDKPGATPTLDALAQPASAGARRVLVIGRDPESRALLATLFGLWGVESDEASAFTEFGIEALSPSLIVLDSVASPEANLENIRAIRRDSRLARVPLILISGYAQAAFRRGALEAGASEVLDKPVDFDALEATLSRHIGVPAQR